MPAHEETRIWEESGAKVTRETASWAAGSKTIVALALEVMVEKRKGSGRREQEGRVREEVRWNWGENMVMVYWVGPSRRRGGGRRSKCGD